MILINEKFIRLFWASGLFFLGLLSIDVARSADKVEIREAVIEGSPVKIEREASDTRGNASMTECGRGHVVGVWPGADGWDNWAIWLSEDGQSWADKDVKIYWAYSHATTDYNSGRMMYSAVLAAQAADQLVAVMDDGLGCKGRSGTGGFVGIQFNSVQIWFP